VSLCQHAGRDWYSVELGLLGATHDECHDDAKEDRDYGDHAYNSAGVGDGIGMDGIVVDEADENEHNADN
jgi:hypothetical protein